METALIWSWRLSTADTQHTQPALLAKGYAEEWSIPHNCPAYQCCSSLNHTTVTLHMAEQEEPTWPALD